MKKLAVLMMYTRLGRVNGSGAGIGELVLLVGHPGELGDERVGQLSPFIEAVLSNSGWQVDRSR